jgi:RNA polymerase sigma-70 factor, ECF subfamily
MNAMVPHKTVAIGRDAGSTMVTTDFVAAFDRLFAEHHARLHAYLLRMSGDADLAADLAQEAFVRLYQRGSVPDSCAAWLVSVANNLLRNSARQSARRRQLLATADRSSTDTGRGDHAAQQEERRRVLAVLAALRPRERELLALLAAGYRYREMAEALDIPEASVGTLLARAKRAFRFRYGEGDEPS